MFVILVYQKCKAFSAQKPVLLNQSTMLKANEFFFLIAAVVAAAAVCGVQNLNIELEEQKQMSLTKREKCYDNAITAVFFP